MRCCCGPLISCGSCRMAQTEPPRASRSMPGTRAGPRRASRAITPTSARPAPAAARRSAPRISITPVNDAPVANADAITVAEGGAITVLAGGTTSVLANDTDAENDGLTAVLVSGPSHGTLTLNPDGTFSYRHDGSETTTDSFSYTANDGSANSDPVTVSIAIAPVNDAPVANADAITVLEGGTVTL